MATVQITLEQLRKKKIVIAVPCYGGMVSEGFLASFYHLQQYFLPRAIDVRLITLTNEALVTRARNTLVEAFLEHPPEIATHLLFIDADIRFGPEDVIKIMRHDREVICGAYPMKGLDWGKLKEYILKHPLATPEEIEIAAVKFYALNFDRAQTDDQGLMEVQFGSTGFMMIERSVFTKMIERFPEIKYGNPPAKEQFAWFEALICKEKNNRYLSEDWLFCHRVQQMGMKIWLDPSIQLSHTGYYTFKGNFTTWVEQHASLRS